MQLSSDLAQSNPRSVCCKDGLCPPAGNGQARWACAPAHHRASQLLAVEGRGLIEDVAVLNGAELAADDKAQRFIAVALRREGVEHNKLLPLIAEGHSVHFAKFGGQIEMDRRHGEGLGASFGRVKGPTTFALAGFAGASQDPVSPPAAPKREGS